MPIKTRPTGTIPFLENYVEYRLSGGMIPADDISDMIAYNFVVPSQSPKIKYNVGSAGENYVDLIIKNLTAETVLNVYLDYNNQVFHIREKNTGIEPRLLGDTTSTTRTQPETVVLPTPVILRGRNQAIFEIKYNKANLNSYTDDTTFETHIHLMVENVFDNKLAIKSITESTPGIEMFLPETVVV